MFMTILFPRRLMIGVLFLFAGSATFAQSSFRVERGDRPAIDYTQVPEDAWEKGIIRIKITEDAARQMQGGAPFIDGTGALRFGLAALDEMNGRHRVNAFDETFASPAMAASFSERHRAWGFDRWYTLYLDENEHIPSVVFAYQALNDVEAAEASFRKRLIAPAGPFMAREGENGATRDWTPDDPQYDQQWHYHNTGQQGGTVDADIDLPEAWDIEKGSMDVIVAIVDEGVQYTHPDLAGNIWEGIGYNFVSNNPNVNPGNHGTHVAGTISAVNNNATGVAGIAGGSGAGDGVRLMSAQVFSGSSSGGFHLAPIWAADQGAAISQNSWGYTSPNVYEQSVLDAIDYFNVNGGGNALSGGGITIFAAGNDDGNAAYYPGYYPGTFAVAATNNQDAKAWYSNYGPWVDLSAPGGETNNVSARGVLSTLNGGSYGFYQGTSMACPHVSGVAALVISMAYGELTPADLADILQNSSDDHYAVNPGYIGLLGTGRLNAYNALVEAQQYLTGVRNPAGFAAQAASQSEIELTWSANPSADPVLLAFSANGQFGAPVAGAAYAQGDSIPGGGQVLYAGPDSAFLHQGLESATLYFYRAWSYSDTLAYSTGRSASAMTACDIYALPFDQGFEEMTSLPACWTQEYASGSVNWTVGAGNGASNPPSAFNGSGNVYFKTTDFLASGLVTRLVTPQLDLGMYETASLAFHYANPLRTFLFWTFQDELKVYYKNSAAGDWNLLLIFDTNVPDWTPVSVTLPNLSGDYYIAFEGMANYGHGVSIDDIIITGSSNVYQVTLGVEPENAGTAWYDGELSHGSEVTLTAEPSSSDYLFSHWQSGTDTLGTGNPFTFEIISDTSITAHFILVTGLKEQQNNIITVRPNPSNGRFIVHLAEPAEVLLFNSQGQLLHHQQAASGPLEINLPELAPGLYLLQANGKNSIAVRRLIIR